MSSTLSQNSTHEAHAWLHEKVYTARRQRTIRLTTQSIDALKKEGCSVSLSAIVSKSRDLDPEGFGISHSAILNNHEARAYYEKHRTWKGSSRRSSKEQIKGEFNKRRHIPINRNISKVRQRYMRMSKAELVERLLVIEQAQAELQEQFLLLNDDLLNWQLRAKQPDVPLDKG